jgi:hypothetical protein
MSSQYELHASPLMEREPASWQDLPHQPNRPAEFRPPFVVHREQRVVLAKLDYPSGTLCNVQDAKDADVALQIADRRFMSHLVVIPLGRSLLVNGVPALKFSALSPRDSLLFSPGALFYVTERIEPHVGPPLPHMLGQKCPCCQLPMEQSSVCVSCKCGLIYHHETETSHPDLPADDRLNCFSKLKNCLACKRELTQEPYLAWDPSEVFA